VPIRKSFSSRSVKRKNNHEVFSLNTFCKQHDSSWTTSVFSTTAAAAGAVCIIRDKRFVSSLNPSRYSRPGGEAFCENSVFSVYSVVSVIKIL